MVVQEDYMITNLGRFKKGSIPHNKGKVGVSDKTRTLMSLSKKHAGIIPPSRKGKKATPDTIAKMLKSARKGELNNKWLGDDVGYSGVHRWIVKWKGQPDTCEMCGKTGLTGRKIGWANVDHSYKRVLDDYIRLCALCHRRYDIKYNNYKNGNS